MVCEICGATEKLQTHHDSYDPEITRVLCVFCHTKIHQHGTGLSKGEYQLRPKKIKSPKIKIELNISNTYLDYIDIVLRKMYQNRDQFIERAIDEKLWRDFPQDMSKIIYSQKEP